MKWNLENTYSGSLPLEFHSKTLPTPVDRASLVIFNASLAKDLDLGEYSEELDLAILAGNSIPTSSTPIALAYSGNQFGHLSQLGDGRAHLLGEVLTPDGSRFDIQLKGSGPTPYSRRGDGRASLGPMLREYIVSEAMNSLGVPTTRSLAVVTTGEAVYRESALPGAILTRISRSHIRVGTFEFAASLEDKSALIALTDYTINRHYPSASSYYDFLKMVCKKNANLIAQWMGVGFIHGVMNTDNMLITGDTIDYGPCAFLDEYDPKKVFSYIDRDGRYAFGKQPTLGLWNLTRFAEALLPFLDDEKEKSISLAEVALASYTEEFKKCWLEIAKRKLGIVELGDHESTAVFQDLLEIMEKYKLDFTNTFRALAEDQVLDRHLYNCDEFIKWKKNWRPLVKNKSAFAVMKKVNPSIIPRNHLIEQCLTDAVEKSSYTKLNRLLDALKNPFDDNLKFNDLKAPPLNSEIVKNTFCGT